MTTTVERKTQSKVNRLSQSNWLRLFLIVVLLLGIFFRFFNLGEKLYWVDETFTSLRISGYTKSELIAEIAQDKVFNIKDLHKYQYANPDTTVIGTIKGLAREEPQHPPFYFTIARFWGHWLGDSVTTTRLLPTLISLLVFPALYWLTQELFSSPLVSWLAVALVAISPFHVLYAQESRQYGLWTVIILLSSAALLRAIRRQTKFSWAIYSATVALGMYTFFFSALVVAAHGIYVIATQGLRLSKVLFAYCLASVGGLIIFLPWLYLSKTSFAKVSGTTSWTSQAVSFVDLSQTWLLNLSRLFVDFNSTIHPQNLLVHLIFAVIVAYGIYFLLRYAPKSASIFIISLIAVTAIVLVAPDLISGGKRSSVTRYFIPCFLGIQISLAYLFANKLSNEFLKKWQPKIWRLILVSLISCGVISCYFSSQSQFWWHKYTAAHHAQIATIINQTEGPLILTQSLEIVPLSYSLDPKVKFYWLMNRQVTTPEGETIKKLTLPANLDSFSDIFYFNSSKKLRDAIELEYGYKAQLVEKWAAEIEPVYEVKNWLWRLIQGSL